jgi:hypothetical protein
MISARARPAPQQLAARASTRSLVNNLEDNLLIVMNMNMLEHRRPTRCNITCIENAHDFAAG